MKETAERGHTYWVDVHRPCEDLGVTLEELDEAIAYGVAYDLLRVNAVAAQTLTVTYEGIELARA